MIENPYAYTDADIPTITDNRLAIEQGFDEGVAATLDYLTTQKGYCDHLAVVDFRIIEQLKREVGQ